METKLFLTGSSSWEGAEYVEKLVRSVQAADHSLVEPYRVAEGHELSSAVTGHNRSLDLSRLDWRHSA